MAFISDSLNVLAFQFRQADRGRGGSEPLGRAGSESLPPVWRRLAAHPAPAPEASPWGALAGHREVAPGISWFRTASRSGYRLSAARQRAVPRGLRTADRWYEDRTEWAAVAVIFDRVFDKMPNADASGAGATLYDTGRETLKNWRPDDYESWFQTTLERDELEHLAVIRFHRLHARRWIAVDASVDRSAPAPTRLLRVRAKSGGDPPYSAASRQPNAPSRWFLVDADEFAHGRGMPFLIDPGRHREITNAFCDFKAAAASVSAQPVC